MFGIDIDMGTLALIGIVAVLFHVALLISSRWLNVLLVVAAGFLFLSPISGATEFPLVVPAKYGRIYCTLLILILGVFVAKIYRLRPVGLLFMTFVAFYTFAAVWSGEPVEGVKYKSLYFLVVLGGFFIAYSIRNLRELESGMRLFGIACAIFAAFILLQIARNPGAISNVGRLAAWGMNGNRIGQTAAPMITVCAYLALYDSAKAWKVFGYVTGVFLGLIIVYTGSRGAAGEGLIGCFVVGIPLMRRPALFGTVLTLFVITVLLVFRFSGADEGASERFFDFSMDTRADPWSLAAYYIQDAYIFGNGWVYQTATSGTPSTENLHSMYIQVFVETGVVGITILGVALLAILYKAWISFREVRENVLESHSIYLALALLVSILAHGFFEAGTVTGSLVNSVLLPFSIGLLDRIPELQRAALASTDFDYEYDAVEEFDEYAYADDDPYLSDDNSIADPAF